MITIYHYCYDYYLLRVDLGADVGLVERSQLLGGLRELRDRLGAPPQLREVLLAVVEHRVDVSLL